MRAYSCLELSHRCLIVGRGGCGRRRLDGVESLVASGCEQIVDLVSDTTNRGAGEELGGRSGGHVARQGKGFVRECGEEGVKVKWERRMARE